MKIGIISDIHVDVNSDYKVIENLVYAIKEENIDCLVIAGDIYNDYKTCLNIIEEIKSLSQIEVYFVPGNHDLRHAEVRDNDTVKIYKELMKNPSCLSGGAKVLSEDWVLIGDIGWYDYSFGNPKYAKEDFEKMKAFDRTWEDVIYVHWGKSNEEMTKFFLDKLENQLETYKDKKKIVVTHMVSRKEFTVPEGNELWDYFGAFLGSSEYGKLFERYSTEYVVLGHVHYRKYGEFRNSKYICSCLNYSSEWKEKEDCLAEIKNALYIINI